MHFSIFPLDHISVGSFRLEPFEGMLIFYVIRNNK